MREQHSSEVKGPHGHSIDQELGKTTDEIHPVQSRRTEQHAGGVGANRPRTESSSMDAGSRLDMPSRPLTSAITQQSELVGIKVSKSRTPSEEHEAAAQQATNASGHLPLPSSRARSAVIAATNPSAASASSNFTPVRPSGEIIIRAYRGTEEAAGDDADAGLGSPAAGDATVSLRVAAAPASAPLPPRGLPADGLAVGESMLV